MKVRVYYPWHPIPPTEGSYFVVADQLRALSELRQKLSLEIELVTWKKASSHGVLPPGVKLTSLANLTESRLRRGLRVLTSLASPLSSTETFHYPPELIPAWESLPPADWACYHYSFAYSWLSEGKGPEEKQRVVYYHNLESDLAEARAAGPLSVFHAFNGAKIRAHETAMATGKVSSVNELWMISQPDLDRLKKQESTVPLRVVPPGYSRDEVQKVIQLRTSNTDHAGPLATFAGKLDFGPNREGLEWILRELCPSLERGFKGKIRIVGKNAPKNLIEEMGAFPFVEHLGFVENFDSLLAGTDVVLVPHLSGSGIRIKLLQSLACGIPSLSHPEAGSRLPPDLQHSPLLTLASESSAWARFLMEWTPESGPSIPAFPESLDSVRTYERLLNRSP